jgi:hypothetical protein
MNQRKKKTNKQQICLPCCFPLSMQSIRCLQKKGEVNKSRVYNNYSFGLSDFTIYTTQAQSDNKNEKIHTHTQTQMKNDMKIKE